MSNLSTKMREKAMENDNWGGRFWLILLGVLVVVMVFVMGFWLGGWRESVVLRTGLEEIADINRCY